MSRHVQLGEYTSLAFDTCALVSIHCREFSLHLGVYPREGSVYKLDSGGQEYNHEYDGWLWGKAIEPYDHCLDYFGLGPFALLVLPNGLPAEVYEKPLSRVLGIFRYH